MELFESLQRRRAVRDFTTAPVPEDILKKLVYAARRAPTVGNAPYRRILLVNNPATIRLVKQVSPGIRGSPAALIIMITDLDAAKQLGRLGAICSPMDAGAAAENVLLAAVDLGLGACLAKSYSEEGLKEILDIPANCRTEIIVQLGYPKKELPPSVKPKADADAIYLDRYGRTWEA
ncbi:MAG: nitroreductase family protein [Nitrososphaerota archaeon]|nr:nitroreductase family protein [Nitrososphaerota archaeon]MDG7026489.1 nitroreductase family protein [Nitrososphaerota archaeon]